MKRIAITGLFLVAFFPFSKSNAQTTGDYRSIKSGNWKSASSWQVFNSPNWVAAVASPTFADGKITIRPTHTITVTDSVYADEIIVNTGGVIDVASGRLYVMNGAGTDMVCNGRLKVAGNAVVERDSSQSVATSSIDYKSDTLFESGGISPDVSFDGTTAQVIIGSGYMGTAIVNNVAAVEITGSVSFRLVHFIVGKILVTGGGLLITDQYSIPGFTGQNGHNYVDGKVVCVVFDSSLHTFNLPIGKGQYMPTFLTVKQDRETQTGFGIRITNGAASARTLPSTLDRVSDVRFYTIDKSSADTSHISIGSLQLTYVADDKVSDTAKLRIAKSEGTTWKNLGGTGSGLPTGVITSTVNFTTPGDFVLANAIGGGNTLPLNIVSFNATAHGNIVVLKWTAEQETNIKLYELQRKTINGGDWEMIGSVTANNTVHYTYTDAGNKKADKLLYRLRQVNKDGHIFYSTEAAVSITGFEKGISIVELYPNPAEQVLHIMVQDNASATINVSIRNMEGRLLMSRDYTANEPLNIPVEMLKSGQYIIKATDTKTGETTLKKFVKK